jgi:hypothetical protein
MPVEQRHELRHVCPPLQALALVLQVGALERSGCPSGERWVAGLPSRDIDGLVNGDVAIAMSS